MKARFVVVLVFGFIFSAVSFAGISPRDKKILSNSLETILTSSGSESSARERRNDPVDRLAYLKKAERELFRMIEENPRDVVSFMKEGEIHFGWDVGSRKLAIRKKFPAAISRALRNKLMGEKGRSILMNAFRKLDGILSNGTRRQRNEPRVLEVIYLNILKEGKPKIDEDRKSVDLNKGARESLKLILESGFSANDTLSYWDLDGYTPLSALFARSNRFGSPENPALVEMVKMLLENGADPEKLDKRGTSPIVLARSEIARLQAQVKDNCPADQSWGDQRDYDSKCLAIGMLQESVRLMEIKIEENKRKRAALSGSQNPFSPEEMRKLVEGASEAMKKVLRSQDSRKGIKTEQITDSTQKPEKGSAIGIVVPASRSGGLSRSAQ